ncbi:NAD(P)/FAD-dependent oxidoreductase [Pseudohaliea sp.]|uniref:flavin-containing monooxygenase n=1 Tax=Pseudohaliea sp. TaxID=2740289 RepID=UPI0032ED9512
MPQGQEQIDAEIDSAPVRQLDALIVGAGVSGLYQLHRLLELGLDVQAFDAAEGVGGTWYWNQYPGAVLDSESWAYAYFFSDELLQEWNWSSEFAPAAEIERYLNFVADRLNLRPHIRLGRRVTAAAFDDQQDLWTVTTDDGQCVQARYLVTAVGFLSATYLPDIPGIGDFKGQSFHTARWPREPIDFTGKRVGVIGTGSTGVQIISSIAGKCRHLKVFQRTPNYCLPLRNAPIDERRMQEIKDSYPEIIEICKTTLTGFPHKPDPRGTFDVSAEEREAFFEEIWQERGFKKWFGNFKDIMVNREANELYAEFVRRKIRERVKDPAVAEKLCPTYHFGAKRPPMETNFYEAFNRDDVELVDVKESPIECITESGVKTTDAEHELDVLIFATGFDAVTGEFERLDIRGIDGETLKEHWRDGPASFMGVLVAGFPNLFLGGGAVFSNFPRCAEATGDLVSRCIAHARKTGATRLEVDAEQEKAWGDHAGELASKVLRSDVGSWFFGNNIPGKPEVFLFYAGGMVKYREKIEELAADEFRRLKFSGGERDLAEQRSQRGR